MVPRTSGTISSLVRSTAPRIIVSAVPAFTMNRVWPSAGLPATYFSVLVETPPVLDWWMKLVPRMSAAFSVAKRRKMSDPPPGLELLMTSIGPFGKSCAATVAGIAASDAPPIAAAVSKSLIFRNIILSPRRCFGFMRQR